LLTMGALFGQGTYWNQLLRERVSGDVLIREGVFPGRKALI